MPCLQIVTPDGVPSLMKDAVDPLAKEQAFEIIDDIKKGGEAAMLQIAIKLGDIKEGESHIKTVAEMKIAYDTLPEGEQALLIRVVQRVRDFAQAQREAIQDISVPVPGGTCGHQVEAVATAGCYAPGGRYPLPSSVIMTAVTARVAGVKNVWVASPRPAQITLAAAYLAGADALLAIGGAQSIAALAYGVGGCPMCDIIVGPGNKWVTAAKSLVNGICAIDMLAGPSECLVVADHTADAAVIAADLLAQSEHDVAALPILVTTSEDLIHETNREIERQLMTLPSAPVASVAITQGYAVLVSSVEDAVAMSDKLGPEHLEIMTEDAQAVAKSCKNYGGIFIGKMSAEVFGDYGVGPNHVLPTCGTSRYTGGLSVFTFLRIRTWMDIRDPVLSQGVVQDSSQLARLEGLEAHARAADMRLLSSINANPGMSKL